MIKPPTVDHLLATAIDWYPADAAWHAEVSMASDYQSFTVSEADLAAYHPQLPMVMRTLNAHCFRYYGAFELSGALLRYTMRHWSAPLSVRVPDGRDLFLGRIADLQFTEADAPSLPLRAHFYDVRPLEKLSLFQQPGDLAPETPFATFAYYEVIFVNGHWLETYFPGWRERWQTATALGYTEQELTDHVCTNKNGLPAAELAGVHFE